MPGTDSRGTQSSCLENSVAKDDAFLDLSDGSDRDLVSESQSCESERFILEGKRYSSKLFSASTNSGSDETRMTSAKQKKGEKRQPLRWQVSSKESKISAL